jgi:hypothetical protein
LLDHQVHDGLANLVDARVGRVLSRQYDAVNAQRLVLRVVLDRDLALRIRQEDSPIRRPTNLAHPAHQTVRIHERCRHQLRGFVHREPEHEALIARALSVPVRHAARDVRGLRLYRREHSATVGVEPRRGARVTNLANRAPRDRRDVEARAGGDLAAYDDEAGLAKRLAGDAAQWILLEACVEHRIGNRVADLVGVPFAHRFGSK